METQVTGKKKNLKWVKRFGFWGFLFFLAKGLLWLLLGYLALRKNG